MSGVNEELRAGVCSELERVLADQTITMVRSPREGEIVLKTNDGTEIWFKGVIGRPAPNEPMLKVQIKTDETMGV